MKNISTKEFCRKFNACREGTKFALKFKTMRDCYAALLAGEAGVHSAEWAIWADTRPGVMSDRDLRLFAVRCARRVQIPMTDARCIAALDVAERYAQGEATDEELEVARNAAWAAATAAVVAWNAARNAAWAAARDAERAAARTAECEAQLALLAEFGNPFEEVRE